MSATAPISFPPNQRISYKSASTGQDYTGYVVDMYTDGGCQIRLDIDGGIKDLDMADLVRVTPVGGAPAASPYPMYSPPIYNTPAPVTYSTPAPAPVTYSSPVAYSAPQVSTYAPTYTSSPQPVQTYSVPSTGSVVIPLSAPTITSTPATGSIAPAQAAGSVAIPQSHAGAPAGRAEAPPAPQPIESGATGAAPEKKDKKEKKKSSKKKGKGGCC
eukprot:TRINITY_DN2735_c0_g1_i1.p1 TRINITY_DN2735_c0_g1~~TRINITY_DN2735_c0_g1_i1.p1  ORF type:complete len:215 (-),score=36.52 TRINITY_DN2735_c0_g1_i1:221-865(-)